MRKTIWVILLIILVIGALALLLSTKAGNNYSFPSKASISSTPTTMLYTNTVAGFELTYPSDWRERQYEAGTGVGFRPADKPNDPQYEYISISISPKPANIASLPFDQYVKVAATNEIQNYQKLASIKPFTTNDGQTGYITTWMVQPLSGGKPQESLPIAYLPSLNTKETIAVYLSDKQYMDIFTAMLKTFQYIDKK
jgi:hypothetical protein